MNEHFQTFSQQLLNYHSTYSMKYFSQLWKCYVLLRNTISSALVARTAVKLNKHEIIGKTENANMMVKTELYIAQEKESWF